MKGQSRTYGQMSLMDTPNATSSPGSGSGPTPSGKPGGPTTGPSGQGVVRASLSARQAKAAGLLTSDISGLRGIGSSGSESLAWSLANRLRVETDLLGSTLYELTWKQRVTPSGRSIYALRASGRRTSGRESTFAPSAWEKTPQASDGDGGVMEVREGSAGKYKLRDFAALASWPTPQANSAERGGSEQRATNPERSNDLHDFAQLASWPTPNAMEGGQTSRSGERKDEMLMGGMVQPSPEGPARLTASGVMLTGFAAGMDGGGQLNPALPRWLQALPVEWDMAAIGISSQLLLHQKKKRGAKSAASSAR